MTDDVWFYNLRVGRAQSQVAAEVRAILDTGPAAFGVCEALGYKLPTVKGWTLVRDTSNQSRANIALYVDTTVGVKSTKWTDLRTTWQRTEHPGTHPPRSFLTAILNNGWHLTVAHLPPPHIPNTKAAQAEAERVLVRILTGHPRAIAVGDYNSRTVPASIAKKVDGTVLDETHIDTAVAVGFKGRAAYPTSVGGVPLRSDHKHAVHFTLAEEHIMDRSQNGWVVLDAGTTGPHPRLRQWVIPGTNRHLMLRDGSAGFLLIHLAVWFDQKVETLDHEATWDDWGYAKRNVRASDTVFSNHASGTAMDLNATQHPMGVATGKTYTPKQQADIRKRLKFYDGCIRWGGDYKNRPDAMHFEIDRLMGPVQARARKLCESPRGKKILEANPGARAVIFS